VSGAPLPYRSANLLHVGGVVLNGLRQHVGVPDDVTLLDKIDEAPEFVPGLKSRLLKPPDPSLNLFSTTRTGIDHGRQD